MQSRSVRLSGVTMLQAVPDCPTHIFTTPQMCGAARATELYGSPNTAR